MTNVVTMRMHICKIVTCCQVRHGQETVSSDNTGNNE